MSVSRAAGADAEAVLEGKGGTGASAWGGCRAPEEEKDDLELEEDVWGVWSPCCLPGDRAGLTNESREAAPAAPTPRGGAPMRGASSSSPLSRLLSALLLVLLLPSVAR